jgi:prepilin-type N-terminal cleavage/methylation domain-containing protein
MKSNRGFTLIEIIITITLIAIAAALFVAYLGTGFTKSPVSSGLVQSQYALIQEMELITIQYRNELNNGTLDLTNFKTSYVDINPYVDAPNTLLTTFTSTSGTYTTQQVLQVTLKNGDQALVSIFTQ